MELDEWIGLIKQLGYPLALLYIYKYIYYILKTLRFDPVRYKEKDKAETSFADVEERYFDGNYYINLYTLGIRQSWNKIKNLYKEYTPLFAAKTVMVVFLVCICVFVFALPHFEELWADLMDYDILEFLYRVLRPIFVTVVIIVCVKIIITLCITVIRHIRAYLFSSKVFNSLLINTYKNNTDLFLAYDIKKQDSKLSDYLRPLKPDEDALKIAKVGVAFEVKPDASLERFDMLAKMRKEAYKEYLGVRETVLQNYFENKIRPLYEKMGMFTKYITMVKEKLDFTALFRYLAYLVVSMVVFKIALNYEGFMASGSTLSWFGGIGWRTYVGLIACFVVLVIVYALEKESIKVFGQACLSLFKADPTSEEDGDTNEVTTEEIIENFFLDMVIEDPSLFAKVDLDIANKDGNTLLDGLDTKTIVKEFMDYINTFFLLPFHVVLVVGIVIALIFYNYNYKNVPVNNDVEDDERKTKINKLMSGIALSLALLAVLSFTVMNFNRDEGSTTHVQTVVLGIIVLVVFWACGVDGG